MQPICLTLRDCSSSLPTWGIPATIDSQSLCISPSAFVSTTLVVGSNVCGTSNNASCEAAHGGTFLANTNNLFKAEGDTFPQNPSWSDINNGSITEYGVVDISFPDLPPLHNFPLGVITKGENYNHGHLGLGIGSSFLASLSDNGYGNNLSFGINVGSKSVTRPRDGYLMVGEDLEISNLVATPISTFTTNSLQPTESDRSCPFQVVVKSINISYYDESKPAANILFSKGSSIHRACIDFYDHLFRFDETAGPSFEEKFPGRLKNYSYDNSFGMEPGLKYRDIEPFDLVVELESGFVVTVPNDEMQRPVTAISKKTGEFIQDDSTTEVQIHEEWAKFGTIVLGRAFLSQVYFRSNPQNNTFSLALSQPDTGMCKPSFETSAYQPVLVPNNPALGPAYAGLALGVSAWIFILGYLAFKFYKRRFEKNTTFDTTSEPESEHSVHEHVSKNDPIHPIIAAPVEPNIYTAHGMNPGSRNPFHQQIGPTPVEDHTPMPTNSNIEPHDISTSGPNRRDTTDITHINTIPISERTSSQPVNSPTVIDSEDEDIEENVIGQVPRRSSIASQGRPRVYSGVARMPTPNYIN